MGQCECTTKADGFKSEVIVEKESLTLGDVPSSVHLLNNFPPISKRIIQLDKKLGQYCPKQFLTGKPYKLKNNSIYLGQWKKHKMNGLGKMLQPDGTLIQSDFLNNKLNGKTRILKINGDYFDGKINLNGFSEGTIFQNGVHYVGRIKENKAHGKGKEVTQKYQFDGEFENGKKIKGKLIWNQQTKYQTIYQGLLVDQEFSNFAKLKTKEGLYEGQFLRGKKEGKGKMIYPNDNVYIGQFSKNQPHGTGELFGSNGQLIQSGTWEHGKFMELTSDS